MNLSPYPHSCASRIARGSGWVARSCSLPDRAWFQGYGVYGNREFVEHLPNRGKFFDHEEKRERDLILIDYDDPARNVYEVTEEWAFHNGHYGTREDVVFLIRKVIQRGGIGKKRRSAKG